MYQLTSSLHCKFALPHTVYNTDPIVYQGEEVASLPDKNAFVVPLGS